MAFVQPHQQGLRPNIYDRNLNKSRTSEVSSAAFAFLFSEVVQYTQKRVLGIADLERRYASYAYIVLLADLYIFL